MLRSSAVSGDLLSSLLCRCLLYTEGVACALQLLSVVGVNEKGKAHGVLKSAASLLCIYLLYKSHSKCKQVKYTHSFADYVIRHRVQ